MPPDSPSLSDSTQVCHQGLAGDVSWSCSPQASTHKLCGHFGTFSFTSPTYEIDESEEFVRISVRRSGGGIGKVSVEYALRHLSTTASDVKSTAFYTNSHVLQFEAGEVEKSFLVAIYDDNEAEEDERFQLFLLDPTGGSSLGNQQFCIVTILDDDTLQTVAALTKITSSSNVLPVLDSSSSSRRLNVVDFEVQDYGIAGVINTITFQTYMGNGDLRSDGGDFFRMEFRLQDDIEDDIPRSLTRHGKVEYGTIIDLGDGSYEARWSPSGTGFYSISIYASFSGGWNGDYYENAWFEGFPITRIDKRLDYAWGRGNIIHHSSDFVTVRWSGELQAPVSETIDFFVRANEHVRVWMSGELVLDAWESLSSVLLPFTFTVSKDAFYAMEIEYRELSGEAFFQLLWKRTGDVTESVVPSEMVFWKRHIQDSPINNVYVIAQSIAPSNSRVHGYASTYAIANQMVSFKVYPRDGLDNPIDEPGDVRPEISLVLSASSGGGIGPSTINADVLWDNKRLCFIATYTSFISGEYVMSVEFDGVHIYGSPFEVLVEPGKLQGSTSVIGVGVTNNGVAGVLASVSIQAKDALGNSRVSGGDLFRVG